jgi:hypothetical protein
VALALLAPTETRADDLVLSTQVGEVDVRAFLPGGAKELRGLIVHAANYGLKDDDRWAELCRVLHFGHVAMNIPRVQFATGRQQKLSKALDEGLKEFAKKSGHPELTQLPLAGVGHSAGGLVTGPLFRAPKQTLGLCLDCAWVLDPDKLPPGAANVPAIFTMGSIPDDYKMLPAIQGHFEPGRKKGLPWGLGVQWGCAHNPGNSSTLFVPWLRAIAEARLPKNVPAGAGPPKLRDLRIEDGWLGDRGTIDGNYATVTSWPDYKGDRETAAWFPDRATAYVWRAFESKEPPVVLKAESKDGKTRVVPPTPKEASEMLIDPDVDVVLGVAVREGTALRKVEFYDGDELLGAAESAPWRFTWRKPARGLHPVFAQWQTTNGKRGVSNPSLIIVRSRVPASR